MLDYEGDALLDNTYLYRTPPAGQSKFGSRMRCSACHVSGAPIMKEQDAPHNDWWMKDHQLTFLGLKLAPRVENKVALLKDASQTGSMKARLIRELALSEALRRSFARYFALPKLIWPQVLRDLRIAPGNF